MNGRFIHAIQKLLTISFSTLAASHLPTASGQQAQLIAADPANGDVFGNVVSISGDTVLVGAYLDDRPGLSNAGSAYVFVRSGGTWTQQIRLTAADAAPSDWFGSAVSLDGDTAVVAARQDDHSSLLNAGSVYVFVRNSGIWTQQAILTPSDAGAQDWFGWSVSVSGDTVLVGSSLRGSVDGIGAAYVFVRSGGTWSQEATLTAADGEATNRFGASVALLGDVAVVGAIYGGDADGAAYIFVRSGGVWVQQAKLEASDAAGGDLFGGAVALSGDSLVVGAAGDDSERGAAYVFARSDGVWTEQARLLAADRASHAAFGQTVAINGDKVIVGALFDGASDGEYAGLAYLYERTGGVWTLRNEITPDDAEADDQFGFSVSMSEAAVAIGSPFDRHSGDIGAGSAYVFSLLAGDLDGDGDVDLADLTQLLSDFGCADGPGACVGDVDADGDTDLGDLTLLLANFGAG